MALDKVYQCSECHQGLIDKPSNFLVLHRTLICQSCFETRSASRSSESLLSYSITLPYTTISTSAIKAAEKLKELMSVEMDQERVSDAELCRKEIEEWIGAAIRKNEGLPKTIEDVMKRKRPVPMIGELTAANRDTWTCPRCALQNQRCVIECSCGYRELRLYGLCIDSSIYWRCTLCGFDLNVLCNGTCSKCCSENATCIQNAKAVASLETKEKKKERCSIA